MLAARPRRLVLASSAAVYGAWPDNPCPLDERRDPRPNPECPYAAQKLAAEQAVPAARGAAQRLQFLEEDDAAAALHLAGTASVTGVCNIAPAAWLDAAGIARVARSRVVGLPRALLLGLAEAARCVRASPFGADRAVLVSVPLALDPGLARRRLGWRASAGSAEALGRFLHNPGAARARS